jgi:hypothetical protein
MRTPTGTWLRAGLAAVLGLALFAGCTDDPKPGTLKTPTAMPTSTTASTTATTPEAEVEATVRAYYVELTRAAQTNDTSKLKTMTTRGCPCYRSVKVIEGNKKAGESTPDAVFLLTSIKVHDVTHDTGSAEVRTSDAAYDVMRNGKTVDHIAAATTHLDLSLVRSEDGRWVIGNEFNLGEG